jgi:hypothetical protein
MASDAQMLSGGTWGPDKVPHEVKNTYDRNILGTILLADFDKEENSQ